MRWMTPEEAASELHCNINRIYDATWSGELRSHVKPWSGARPKRLRAEEDLDAWVRSWRTIPEWSSERSGGSHD